MQAQKHRSYLRSVLRVVRSDIDLSKISPAVLPDMHCPCLPAAISRRPRSNCMKFPRHAAFRIHDLRDHRMTRCKSLHSLHRSGFCKPGASQQHWRLATLEAAGTATMHKCAKHVPFVVVIISRGHQISRRLTAFSRANVTPSHLKTSFI